MSREAKLVAAWIRSVTRRPKELPYFDVLQGSLRFNKERCPLGLVPQAADNLPTELGVFPDGVVPKAITDDHIESFWQWWDSVPEECAADAMDAVWGKKRAKTR